MPKPFIQTLVGISILLMLPLASHGALTASANRTQYAPRDNIVLKVETDNPSQSPLDTTPLQSQFIILDQKKMMINSYAEGKRSSMVRWELQLRARKSGYLDIPSLTHNLESSDAFSIYIKSKSPTRFLPVTDMPIILDAQLQLDDNYEQALYLYTLNIYSDQPLATGYTISEPKINKAQVQLLDQSAVQIIEIRGREYHVIEQRYAIFPTEMGRYIIEGPIFNGSQQDGSQIQVRANNLEINVRARQDYDSATYWLPASNVRITESWQKNPTLRVGDIIKRQITLTVDGIAAANLPALITETPETINIQDTKLALTDKTNKNGVQGIRVELQKIQLLERGEITFPKIRIYWWDTNSDSQKSATISKQILKVLPGINGESSIEREIAQNSVAPAEPPSVQLATDDISWLLWLLGVLALLSSIGWLFNLRKIKQLNESELEGFETITKTSDADFDIGPGDNQRQEPIMPSRGAELPSFNAKAELNTFQLLGRACLKNDLLSANRRLLEWANQFWYEQQLENIQDIADIANDSSLELILMEMQELLNIQAQNRWQGRKLFNMLTQLREN